MSLPREEVTRLREKLDIKFSVTIAGAPHCQQHHVMSLLSALNEVEILKRLVLHILDEMDKKGGDDAVDDA